MGAGAGTSPAVAAAGRDRAAAKAQWPARSAPVVAIRAGLAVGLDEELRFLRIDSVLSRIECLTTTFCSLNRMTNSFCWMSRPPTNAPTYGMKFSAAFAVLRAPR